MPQFEGASSSNGTVDWHGQRGNFGDPNSQDLEPRTVIPNLEGVGGETKVNTTVHMCVHTTYSQFSNHLLPSFPFGYPLNPQL